MGSLFSRFGVSFTPFFLRKYNTSLAVGKSIGYYFFWSFVFGVLGTIIGIVVCWHFFAVEKIFLWLDKIPAFEITFEDNQLVKTSFPEDPYTIVIKNQSIVTISSTIGLADVDKIPLENRVEGVYILRDGFITAIQNKGAGIQEGQAGRYSDMQIGDKIINNAFVLDKFKEIHPALDMQVIFILLPVVLMVLWTIFIVYFFIQVFIWAGFLKLICFIRGFPQLTYSQLAGFSFYTFFLDILLTSIVFSIFALWFSLFSNIIIGSFISLMIFLVNVWFLKK